MNGSTYPLLFPGEFRAIQQGSYIRGDGIPGAKADSFRGSMPHCDDLTNFVNITLAYPSYNGDAYRHIIKAFLSYNFNDPQLLPFKSSCFMPKDKDPASNSRRAEVMLSSAFSNQ